MHCSEDPPPTTRNPKLLRFMNIYDFPFIEVIAKTEYYLQWKYKETIIPIQGSYFLFGTEEKKVFRTHSVSDTVEKYALTPNLIRCNYYCTVGTQRNCSHHTVAIVQQYKAPSLGDALRHTFQMLPRM